jgi:hypothetical protein
MSDYPSQCESDVCLRDSSWIDLRPLRPDDATKHKVASFYLQALTANQQMMKVLSRSRLERGKVSKQVFQLAPVSILRRKEHWR